VDERDEGPADHLADPPPSSLDSFPLRSAARLSTCRRTPAGMLSRSVSAISQSEPRPKTRLPMRFRCCRPWPSRLLGRCSASVEVGSGSTPKLSAEKLSGLLAEKLASTTGRPKRASPAPKTLAGKIGPPPGASSRGRRQHPGRFRDG